MMIWNQDKTASLRSWLVRKIVISQYGGLATVRAWVSGKESFVLGQFNTISEAQGYVDEIHKMLDAGK